MHAFRFAPVTKTDTPMLRDWLSTPHAQEWWGEPEHEIGLIFDGERTGQSSGYIAHHAEEPFAYVQSWPCDAQPADAVAKEPWVANQAANTLGVDIVIGRPDLLGKGLGSTCVRVFCDKLFSQGASRIIIDPDAANTRALRAYEKAGFTRFASFTKPDGSITQLMEKFPSEGQLTQ